MIRYSSYTFEYLASKTFVWSKDCHFCAIALAVLVVFTVLTRVQDWKVQIDAKRMSLRSNDIERCSARIDRFRGNTRDSDEIGLGNEIIGTLLHARLWKGQSLSRWFLPGRGYKERYKSKMDRQMNSVLRKLCWDAWVICRDLERRANCVSSLKYSIDTVRYSIPGRYLSGSKILRKTFYMSK